MVQAAEDGLTCFCADASHLAHWSVLGRLNVLNKDRIINLLFGTELNDKECFTVFLVKENQSEEPVEFIIGTGNDFLNRKIYEFLSSRISQFANKLDQIGKCNIAEHRIDTSDAKAISCQNRRYSPQDTATIELEIKKMLENGLIVESSSDWTSPILLVPKPDGSKRTCVDFRALNSLTKKDL